MAKSKKSSGYNPEDFRKMLKTRMTRRDALKVGAGVAAVIVVGGAAAYYGTRPPAVVTPTTTMAQTTAAPTTTAAMTTAAASFGPEDAPYVDAANKFIQYIGTDTVLTPDQLTEEVMDFVKASKPYRGQSLIVMYEAIAVNAWDAANLKSVFEGITGITTAWQSMGNWDTIVKQFEDHQVGASTGTGIYDLLGTDQDENGYYYYNKSTQDVTAMAAAHPQLVTPYMDMHDIQAWQGDCDAKGDLYGFYNTNAYAGTVYRKDWFTDPTEAKNFETKYGYPLKTPLQWYQDARASGKVSDDWTIKKMTDCIEFFTRPSQNMWGTVTGAKAGDYLFWYFGDGFDDCFQMMSPAAQGHMPIEVGCLEPITSPWGIHIENGLLYGMTKAEGGVYDGTTGQAMYTFWFDTVRKYSPSKIYSIDVIEAHNAFAYDGTYALMTPFYMHWGPSVLPSAQSKVADVFEFGPYPVYEPNYHPRKPRGYIDPSGWVGSAYSKYPEATFLFQEFMNSKAIDLKRTYDTGIPNRWSTIDDSRYTANDDKWGKMITLLRLNGWNGFGTDARLAVYPFLLGLGRDKTLEYFSAKMSSANICKAVAADCDHWIKDNGWYKVNMGDMATWPTSTANFGAGVTVPTYGGADPRTMPASASQVIVD
jgi:hypothetical protein